MDIELMRIALNVLRACTEYAEPRQDDVAVLKARLGPEAERMAVDELARTIVERSMRASRRMAGAGR